MSGGSLHELVPDISVFLPVLIIHSVLLVHGCTIGIRLKTTDFVNSSCVVRIKTAAGGQSPAAVFIFIKVCFEVYPMTVCYIISVSIQKQCHIKRESTQAECFLDGIVAFRMSEKH